MARLVSWSSELWLMNFSLRVFWPKKKYSKMPSRGRNQSTNIQAIVLEGCRLSISTFSMTMTTTSP